MLNFLSTFRGCYPQEMRRATITKEPRLSCNTTLCRISFIEEPKRRDIKTVKSRAAIQENLQILEAFLKANNFRQSTSRKTVYNPTIKESVSTFVNPTCPSAKEVSAIFLFLFRIIDASITFTKYEDEVISLLKLLKYPFLSELNRSQLVAVTPHTWPVLLAALTWLVQFIDNFLRAVQYSPQEDGVQSKLNFLFYEYVCQAYKLFLNNEDETKLQEKFLSDARNLCDEKYVNMDEQIKELKDLELAIENLNNEFKLSFEEHDRSLTGFLGNLNPDDENSQKNGEIAKNITTNDNKSIQGIKYVQESILDAQSMLIASDIDLRMAKSKHIPLYEEKSFKRAPKLDAADDLKSKTAHIPKMTRKQFFAEKISQIQKDNGIILEKIKKHHLRIKSVDNSIQQLESEIKALETENTGLKHKIEVVKGIVLKQSISPQQLESINLQKTYLYNKLEEIKPKIGDLTSKLHSKEKEKAELVFQIEALIGDFKTIIPDLSLELRKLNESIYIPETRVDSLIYGKIKNLNINDSFNTLSFHNNSARENHTLEILQKDSKRETSKSDFDPQVSQSQEIANQQANSAISDLQLKLKHSINQHIAKGILFEKYTLNGDILEERRAIEDIIHDHENTISDLNDEINNLEAKNEELSEELCDIKRKRESAEKLLIQVSETYLKNKVIFSERQKMVDTELDSLNESMLRNNHDDMAEIFILDNEIEKNKHRNIKNKRMYEQEKNKLSKLVDVLERDVRNKLREVEAETRKL